MTSICRFYGALLARAIMDEDEAWFAGADAIVTFEACCEVLGINVAFFRRQLADPANRDMMLWRVRQWNKATLVRGPRVMNKRPNGIVRKRLRRGEKRGVPYAG